MYKGQVALENCPLYTFLANEGNQNIFSCPQNNYTMRYISLLFIVCACSNAVLAVGRTDSAFRALQELVVSAERYVSPIRTADMKSVEWDMDFMHRLPKIMGNADPVRYSQLLPGVQTNAEYDSGLHIYGCEWKKSDKRFQP